ncbi:aggregation-promoting factor C-terminal-like domain-containing protein [Nocardiopsis halotolerans]|uniref:aggregation-promoting factor C-terminal-like domain-containing protein n=1 Tax=Nocardiopsis halotolerans TaxID=124252 RepID=UPI000365EEB6|nr:lytic transglycosylase domain-containing protein [Nocardiopsis halotolerans]
MPLNLFSLRHAGAIGAAALVAGGTFSIGAFAQSDAVEPERLSSAAVLPDQHAAGGGNGDDKADDFFATPPEQGGQSAQELEDQRAESLEQARAAVDQAVQAESGTGSEVPEPEPEPEPEATEDDSSGGGSDSSGSGSTSSAPSGSPREIALQMVLDQGWPASEFHDCLEPLWEKESNWDHTAENPSSGAYGIPQALPGDKMASHGDDWRTNPATQIAWGLDYIEGRYGNPCGAWSHSQANNWY